MSNSEAHLTDEAREIIDTLVGIVKERNFRTAWTLLSKNIPSSNVRVKDAGIELQNLSNLYGDIGNIKDDCVLRRELEQKVERIVALLV